MRKLIKAVTSNAPGSTIGRNHPHESAIRQVSGSAVYVDDKNVPANTLFAAVGLSPVSRGIICEIDLTQVKQSEGVVDVITAKDVPGHLDIGPVFDGDPVLADKHVVFHGQALFAVVATSVRLARQAVLKAIINIEAQTPVLHPDGSHQAREFVRPKHEMHRGDPKSQMQSAENRVVGSLEVGGQEHLYLEGQVSLAVPKEEDRIMIYTSSQHPSEVQKLVAEVLGLKLNKVVVDMRRMGGGFGGKETQAAQWACIAALLAVRTRRPVKIRLPRLQDMLATGKRHPFSNHFEVGFDKTGLIQASQIVVNGDCGHSPDLSDAIVDRAMFHADNAYFLADTHIVGHRCRTNKVSNTAFRGFGGPQGMVVAEAMLDAIARKIGEDPLTVRKRNFYDDDQRKQTQYGMDVDHNILPDLVAKLEQSSQYWQRRELIKQFNQSNPLIKKGLALTPVKFGISFTAKHLNQAGALLHVYTDGSMQINHGGTEMGQGLHTKIGQIVAHEFGLPLSEIEVTSTRTDKVPNTSPTAASSGTDMNGKAAQNACLIIKQRLAEFYAAKYQQDPSLVRFEDQQVLLGQHSMPFTELVQQAYFERISLSATGFYKTPKIHYERDVGKGRPFFYFAYGASVSEVSIDTLTGEYSVDRVDILHDVGSSLNPAIDIGQIEGGFIQGMGWLTTEELVWDAKGALLSNNPATYKIPAIGDTPKIFNVELYPHSNPEDSIYHSKAVGEPPLMLAISVWCAIKDAISSLSDYTIDPQLDTPATPEKVLMAVDKIQKSTNDKAVIKASL
ncbi:xanthine dehydrogenase molybdopterin binding subunit [Aliiglaciecola sp. LCG003]|uniref:xanthine dehydrogenase molybdopterin binding subunit n=1 Tax=Aliiglaciecola sp. LCG003 TaxID=3053655 RepID=UPI002573B5DA|nr:xanthine dehydrogenase molybdopterin binding subunit [Aliiglaciecola sp. LCG003]WJG11217.1 xanthine dehydrogenase molybdopterin binding subunit [Aliiglaciecola sp. LCG003]